ncbi:MAG: hypothetical protein ACJAR2_000727 [Ilumatobacter sp.]|jgi:hypothetical protein
MATFDRGGLSLDRLAPILGHAPGWSDVQMSRPAPRCTVAQIFKIARQYPWETGTFGPTDESDTGDETANAHVNVGADSGLLNEAALIEARNSLFQAGDTSADTVDAVIEMANRLPNAIPSQERRNRYRDNVHLREDGAASDFRGRLVPNGSAQRIACDTPLSPITWVDGVPVSVGRSPHIVSNRSRRIIEHRDGGDADASRHAGKTQAIRPPPPPITGTGEHPLDERHDL